MGLNFAAASLQSWESSAFAVSGADRTVMFWGKLGTNGAAVYPAISHLSGDTGANEDLVGFYIYNGGVYAVVGNNAGGDTQTGPYAYSGTDWHHYACVIDSSANTIEIFVDGVSVSGPTATDTDPYTTSQPFRVGRLTGTYLNGDLFDIRYYNRIFTAAELLHITASRGADNVVNSLVARWIQNESPAGSTASGAGSIKDCGTGANHATTGGSPTYTASPMSLVIGCF